MSDICCNQLGKLDLFKLQFSEIPSWQFVEGEKKALLWSVSLADSMQNKSGSNHINKQLISTCNAHMAFMLSI